MKIYISGKITGMEEQAFILFEEAEKRIIAQGHEPVNPMKLTHTHDKTWVSYMKDCIRALMDCDGILLLDNWQDSEGARTEHKIARKLYYKIFHEL